MWIKEIYLKGFGKFIDRSIPLSPGLNVLFGENEAGKSTILNAIFGVFFGFKRDQERYRPWQNPTTYQAKIKFEDANRIIAIERDFISHNVNLDENDNHDNKIFTFSGSVAPGGRGTDKDTYLKKTESYLGVADPDLLLSSIFLRQRDLGLDDGKVLEKIKQLLSGATEADYDLVLQSLEDKYFSITYLAPDKQKRKPGELDLVKRRIAELTERIKKASQVYVHLDQLLKETKELEKILSNNIQLIEKTEKMLAVLERQERIEKEEKQWRERSIQLSAECAKVERLTADLDACIKSMSALKHCENLSPEFPNQFKDCEEIKNDISIKENENQKNESDLKQLKKPSLLSAVFAPLLFFAVSIVSGLAIEKFLITSIFLGLAIAVFIFIKHSLPKFREYSKYKKEISELKAKSKKFEGEITSLKERKEKLQKRIFQNGVIDEKSLGSFMIQFQEWLNLQARKKELENKLDVLPNLDDLQNKLNDSIRELAIIRKRKDDLIEENPFLKTFIPDKIIDLTENRKENLKNIDRLKNELNSKQKMLAVEEKGIENPALLEEQLIELEEQQRVLNGRAEALYEAKTTLEASLTEYRETFIERFAKEISNYFAIITKNKYERIWLDDGFNPKVSGADGKPIPIELLSIGTQDQIYFAIRFALVKKLSHGKTLPFFLDDPFGSFDGKRRRAALDLLTNISHGTQGDPHQIILFVHDQRYKEELPEARWVEI